MDFVSRVPQLVSSAAASTPAGFGIPILVSAYLILVQALRFRRLKKMHAEFNYPTRESYAKMTDDESWRILRLMGTVEFPFTFYKALQFSLFKVSRVLRGVYLFDDVGISSLSAGFILTLLYIICSDKKDLWNT